MHLVFPSAVLLLAGALSLPASGHARTPLGVFRHVTLEEGLSDTHLRSIVQDRDGFLWFGTFDGLNRYDGYRIRIFRHEPGRASSLGSSFVRALSVDRSGSLWVGTIGGGLHRYDPLTEEFVRYPHDPGDPETIADDDVYSIWDDGNGALWIGTGKGLDRMDRSTGRFRHFRHDPGDPESLSHEEVYAVLRDRRGSLWVGTWGGGLHKLDPERENFTRYSERGLPGALIWSISGDREGRLSVGAVVSGLSLLDRASDSFRAYRHDPDDCRGSSKTFCRSFRTRPTFS